MAEIRSTVEISVRNVLRQLNYLIKLEDNVTRATKRKRRNFNRHFLNIPRLYTDVNMRNTHTHTHIKAEKTHYTARQVGHVMC
jgi:hypothetical protein